MSIKETISPLDGRYKEQLKGIANDFCEFNLFRNRIFIELEWFKVIFQIVENINLNQNDLVFLDNIYKNFNNKEMNNLKIIEKRINHDMKAVEYYIKSKFNRHQNLKKYKELIHFGITSEDINNLAYAIILKNFITKTYSPQLKLLITKLKYLSWKFASGVMPAFTHGQIATPTTMGKEIANYVARIEVWWGKLENLKYRGKFNGSVGNYNSLVFAFSDKDWIEINRRFVNNFDLNYNEYTTQIEPHDFIAELSFINVSLNTILQNFTQDIWMYVSFDYFKQKNDKYSIGSSVMPHKINPIKFENAEGNLGIANALFLHFATKLLSSRLQRDLSDSTVLRNLSTAFAHSFLAVDNILIGLEKLSLNQKKMNYDLESNPQLIGEALQTIMRKFKIKNSYEQVKKLLNDNVNRAKIDIFIKKLKIPKEEKDRLLNLTNKKYIGLAASLAEKI